MSEPIIIWGAGAIGATIGAYLVRNDVEVIFVDSDKDHVNEINHSGIHVEGPIDNFKVQAKAVLPHDVTGKYSRIWLCVKAQHTASTVEQLSNHLSHVGYVLSLQNGLNEILISRAVGEGRTLGAFINFGADYIEPGKIMYGGRGAVVLGELDKSETPRLLEAHNLMKVFDKDAEVTDNIWGYLWGKLGYGALLFATALTNESIADVLADKKYQPMLKKLASELSELAAAQNIKLQGFNGYDPYAFLKSATNEKATNSFDAMVAHNQKSAKSHSGIWRDLAVRKRKTEVNPQLTLPVSLGEELGHPMLITRLLISLITEIENGERSLGYDNLEELNKLVHAAENAS